MTRPAIVIAPSPVAVWDLDLVVCGGCAVRLLLHRGDDVLPQLFAYLQAREHAEVVIDLR